MSYLQILILVVALFAFSYLVYSATEVSAQTGNHVCCEETTSGENCQFVKTEECKAEFRSAPTECKYTDFCKEGCCITNDGFCSKRSTQRDCQGGRWLGDEFCNVAECQRGCCIIGSNALWLYPGECNPTTWGREVEFRSDIRSEIECIFLAEREDEGACVREEGCRFITRGDCASTGGTFYRNTFCSNPALGTNCIAQDHAGCIDGEDSVYWFDSCGNKEDIKEECNLYGGTICGEQGGEYVCKNIDCVVDGRTRKNGESWCEYDGTVGDGKDVVGSRHVRHFCFLGEERIEPCQDYRNQICVGEEKDLGNGQTFSEAACRVNTWRECVDYNTRGRASLVCEENPDCKLQRINVDDFEFDFCVPQYPPGFDLTNEGGGKNAELVCSMGTQTCTMIYEKKITGKWECEANCHCKSAVFTQQMNDLCISLGDCGGYVNIAGEATDDGYTSGGGKIDLNQYKRYARENPNQEPAEPGDLRIIATLGGPRGDVDYRRDSSLSNALGVYGIGYAAQVMSWKFAGTGATWSEAMGLVSDTGAGYMSGSSGYLGAFGNALVVVGTVMIAAHLISLIFGMDYDDALLVAGISVAVMYFTIAGQSLATLTSMLWKIFPWLIIIWIILELFGIGDTKKKTVQFQCLPWQPPAGGRDCGRCNDDDPLGVPCSPYRCKSLGQTCELINQGTDQELCIDNSPHDVTSPRISPLLGTITEGYQYVDTKHNNFVDGFEILDLHQDCIPEYTQVLFGIETDKPSQCKIGINPLANYESMEEYFGGSNLYLDSHTMLLNIPSPEAFRNQYELTSQQIRELGEVNYYVKCKSVNGVVNSAAYTIRTCVEPGPDLTVPYVVKTSPVNGGHLAYNISEKEVEIWINEPASCKYSVEDRVYELMENSFTCKTDLEDYSLWGWPCDATLTNLKVDNKFYIRCQDLSENKNTMSESYLYELRRSGEELTIEETKPEDGGEVVSGFEPVTVNLEILTSGGAENGKAECSYKFREEREYIRFYETFSSQHKQVFSSMIEGDYRIYLECEDVAGNIARKEIDFRVDVDNEAPIVTRIYYDGSLKVITDEAAICGYSSTDTRCNFDVENSTLMSGEGKEHSADWQTDSTYYIKCQDIYENEPGRCSIIARPYSLT